jgi:dihydropteroate synthase
MNNEELTIRNFKFAWGKRTYLMGILNITPDSFSDGGEYNTLDSALFQGKKLIQGGADLLDIGGQSTRPGAEQVSLEEELDRVIPVIKNLRLRLSQSIPISIDTTRAKVAEEAIKAGADLVNDISAATFDQQMLSTVAKLGVPLILMHIKGTPKTMQSLTNYDNLIAEIYHFLETRINAALDAGIRRSHLIIDPGIGFGKTLEQNLEILKNLWQFTQLNLPILVGTSRKSFIGKIIGQANPQKRKWGTAATCCVAIANGADIMRIHDVSEMSDVCQVADAIYR